MNAGMKTIDWLYREQLKVDPEWSVKKSNGFTWWPATYAQTIEIAGEEVGPAGDTAQWISIHTEMLRDVELSDETLLSLNSLLMPVASLSGPVYVQKNKSLSLKALVRVHANNQEWMRVLLSMISVTQFEEAARFGSLLADLTESTAAMSEHPASGVRELPDELTRVVADVVLPIGEAQPKWTQFEFESLAEQFFEQPPCLMGTLGTANATIEFPYGTKSSLCQMVTNRPHPNYGNGLLILQSFPFRAASDAAGARTALSLNERELVTNSSGCGMGSYSYRDNRINFTAFYPNAVHQTGQLPDFYFATAARAKDASEYFTDSNWDEKPFEPSQSALGRVLAMLRGGRAA